MVITGYKEGSRASSKSVISVGDTSYREVQSPGTDRSPWITPRTPNDTSPSASKLNKRKLEVTPDSTPISPRKTSRKDNPLPVIYETEN